MFAMNKLLPATNEESRRPGMKMKIEPRHLLEMSCSLRPGGQQEKVCRVSFREAYHAVDRNRS